LRFVLLVEGDTEKNTAAEFLRRWLDPRLIARVGIHVVRYKGNAELARKIVKAAQMHLDGPAQSEIVAVIGLLDLYGPNFYPDHLTTAAERYSWAKSHFEREVARERFRMFFAVHEFEAWLLSEPDIFPREIKSALPGKISRPEQVNFDEPPARLLDKIYKARLKKNYKKTTNGKELFAKLNPETATAKCPYLATMLEEMHTLAKAAGL